MVSRASAKKILDPTGTGAAENMNMALRGPPGKTDETDSTALGVPI
jgi:hypothetical protein